MKVFFQEIYSELKEFPIDKLINIRNDLVGQIFQIGTPCSAEELKLLEILSVKCDVIDEILETS
ncbi:MAG: hypothetical protein M0T74_05925 [Desulfitobacterium hafniense]|nr:hypothetical protein [Desulfitobacterium hafniense]